MTSTPKPLNYIKSDSIRGNPISQAELVQHLLYQIVRVKELIKYYDGLPSHAGQLGSAILTELIQEAHGSLVNYDITLMEKYYDLLLNCD
jgi:hypothetical protein